MAQAGKTPIQFWRGQRASLITELPFTGANYPNGIIEFFGKGKDTGGTWSNPDLSGAITLTLSSHQGGTNTQDRLVRTDALSSRTSTQNLANSYFRVEFPAQLDRVRIDSYMFRTSAFTNRHPITWQIRGSIDGVAWTVIDDRINETALNGLTFTQVHFTATGPGAGQWWKFVEILQTGPNFNGFDYLELARFEFFGAFGIVPDDGEPIFIDDDSGQVNIGDAVSVAGRQPGRLPAADETILATDEALVVGDNATSVTVTTRTNREITTLPTRFLFFFQFGVRYLTSEAPPRANRGAWIASLFNVTQNTAIAMSDNGLIDLNVDEVIGTREQVGYGTAVETVTPGDVIRLDVNQSATPSLTLSQLISGANPSGLTRLGFMEIHD